MLAYSPQLDRACTINIVACIKQGVVRNSTSDRQAEIPKLFCGQFCANSACRDSVECRFQKPLEVLLPSKHELFATIVGPELSHDVVEIFPADYS
jgi:hypothetical protein